MTSDEARREVISELQIGHLGKAMNLVEQNQVQIDDEIRREAATACAESLREHFHWIVPLFVKTFGIAHDPDLNRLASKIIILSVRHGQPLIASLAARTFDIELDETAQALVEAAKQRMVTGIQQADVLAASDGSGEYNFTVE